MNYFNRDRVCKPHIGKILKKFDEHERFVTNPKLIAMAPVVQRWITLSTMPQLFKSWIALSIG